LWDIVEDTEDALATDEEPKVVKAYYKRMRRVIAIIATNLVDCQLAHIHLCKDPTKTWSTLYTIH